MATVVGFVYELDFGGDDRLSAGDTCIQHNSDGGVFDTVAFVLPALYVGY